MAQKLSKKGKMAESGTFQGFLAITSEFLNILQNGFLLVHQWFQALLLMHNKKAYNKVNNISLNGIWDLPFMFFGSKRNTLIGSK